MTNDNHAALCVSGMAAPGAGGHAMTDAGWTRDVTGRQYTLIQGVYHGMVWHASTGEWIALLSQDGHALQHTRCLTLKEAQAWCEAQLAALVAARRCTGD
jgi:hypothetical protein